MPTYFKSILFSKRSGGFTLAELIVVIAIASAITTALVIQQTQWREELAVKTRTYEIAMMLRQAQVYSLGVRENTAGTGNKFEVGYGVHLDTNGSVADRAVFFADRGETAGVPYKYESAEKNDNESKVFKDVKLFRICAGSFSSGCGGGPTAPKQIDISFRRPYPQAHIKFLNGSGVEMTTVSPPAYLRIKSSIGSGNKEMVIKVEESGQISIIQ